MNIDTPTQNRKPRRMCNDCKFALEAQTYRVETLRAMNEGECTKGELASLRKALKEVGIYR